MAGKVGMEWKKIKKSSGIRYVPQNPVVLHARTRLGITGGCYAIGVVAGMKMGLCIGNGLDGRMNKEQQEFWQDLSVPPLNRRGCRNCIHFGPSGLLSDCVNPVGMTVCSGGRDEYWEWNGEDCYEG